MKMLKIKCSAYQCKKKFSPKRLTQVYCSQACRNREAQRRLRDRARITPIAVEVTQCR